jgi:hypothetical protein
MSFRDCTLYIRPTSDAHLIETVFEIVWEEIELIEGMAAGWGILPDNRIEMF